MQLKSFSFQTSDGFEHWVNRWIPDENVEIKGIIQLHHGLAEHSLRYDRFGSILAENGYVLNAYDMRGHGKTGDLSEENGKGKMGKIADKNGYKIIVEDLHEIIEDLKKKYPGVPTFLMGHSFGSFVSQGFIENYSSDIQGCILSGTAGPRKMMIGVSAAMVSLITLFTGKNKVVPLLDKLAFGSYNKGFDEKSKYAWLSKDTLNVELYEMDNWCGIDLRAGFFKDMTKLLSVIHKNRNIKKIRNDLPVLFIYGTKDPVGNQGKTIQKLIGIYKKKGMNNISCITYEDARHELLNDFCKEKTEADILNWLSTTLTQQKK